MICYLTMNTGLIMTLSRKSVENILKILSANEPGVSNPEANEKITSMAESIREATTDSFIGEKTVEIKTWADACYSDSKHQLILAAPMNYLPGFKVHAIK